MMPPVAILAGGFATRLAPLSDGLPKSLAPVAGEPFIRHQLRWLAGQGVHDVVLCTGHLGAMIRDALGTAWGGIALRYSDDGPQPLGTGGAIRHALPLLGREFLTLYGDSYLPMPIAPVVAAFRAAGAPALMTVFRNEGRWGTSNVLFEGGQLIAYDKRAPTPAMRHIDHGLGAFRTEAFDNCPDRFDLADHYAALAARGALAGFEATERFYEIGSPEGLAETDRLLRSPA